MNRMVYVLPEMVMIILLEVTYGVLSFVILFSYYGNIGRKKLLWCEQLSSQHTEKDKHCEACVRNKN